MKKYFSLFLIIVLVACASETFVEKDPVWLLSPFAKKTNTDISHWDIAYQKSLQAPTSVSIDSAVAQAVRRSSVGVKSWNGLTGYVVVTTDNLKEGLNNQYWTVARSDARYYTKAAIDSFAASIKSNNGGTVDAYTKNESDSRYMKIDSAYGKSEANFLFATVPSVQSLQSTISNQQNIITSQQQWIDSVKNASIPIIIQDGTTITYDARKGYNQEVTIAGTRTINIISDVSGNSYSLTIYQNGNGAYNINVPSGNKMLKGTHSGNTIYLNHDNKGMTVITWYKKGNIRIYNKGDYD